tara:strand:- start:734 stop:1039 length:306 start_codon:yes stop_codon:yes gene_type:complete
MARKRRPTTLGFSRQEHEDKFQIAADFCKEYGKRFMKNIGEGKCDLAFRNLNRHANVIGQSLVHLNAAAAASPRFSRLVRMQRKMERSHADYMATFEEDCT